ncbi:Sucrose transport protein SUT4 [Porphyridium purpureum]|uniref:Sucrose transport protein SUT4 n=1 Tax=Porphyridium purpureum TaxID=35688 RepID=A0A5J4YRM6_PORPP|nr:Sucrose transport protein SUT4 [Porphyridium purpureum]|eukprot:POR4648..scf229_5
MMPVRSVLPMLAYAAVQLVWATQIGHATPLLRSVGILDADIPRIWLAAPLMGICVQPVVGLWSDSASCCGGRLGRRRPFMIAGAVCTVISMNVFANSPRAPGSELCKFIAIASFWMLDGSINMIQGPLRALLADTVPPAEQPMANALFATGNGLGKTIGYGLGSASMLVHHNSDNHGGYALLFGAASVIFTTLISVSLCFMREMPVSDASDATDLEAREDSSSDLKESSRTRIFRILTSLVQDPAWPYLLRAGAVQTATYFAWYGTFIFWTDWSGSEVFGGNADASPGSPERHLFDRGVRIANLGLCLMGAMSMALSTVFPFILRICGVRWTWTFCELVLASVLLGSWYVPLGSATAVLVASTLLSIPLSSTFTIPWSIVTLSLENSPNKGAFTSLFNLCQCVPQVLVSLISPALIRAHDGHVHSVLLLGGAGALLGTLLIPFLASRALVNELFGEPSSSKRQ